MNKEEEMGDLYFERPVNYPVSDPYGSRGGTHYGIDYAAPKGSSVRASERGVVVRAADHPKTETRKRAYGNVIVIDHAPDAGEYKRHIYTLYAHLDWMSVRAGGIVKKGETIGASGNTGMSTGPHLHFEIIDAGSEPGWSSTGAMGVPGGRYRIDPEGYFGRRTSVEDALP
ncbi:MAG TPA: M23 family metallopeptidase [Thermodesulfobacteriota bacterium]|nr:M23 family metallopeptidase [Thermodesulfobacteriota bacterium]